MWRGVTTFSIAFTPAGKVYNVTVLLIKGKGKSYTQTHTVYSIRCRQALPFLLAYIIATRRLLYSTTVLKQKG